MSSLFVLFASRFRFGATRGRAPPPPPVRGARETAAATTTISPPQEANNTQLTRQKYAHLHHQPPTNSNTDESPGVATEYGIRSIPTIMIFKGGSKMETVIGAVPKSTLVQSIEKFL